MGAVYEVLKDVLVQKEKAENVLIKYYTNCNWTIIRPGEKVWSGWRKLRISSYSLTII